MADFQPPGEKLDTNTNTTPIPITPSTNYHPTTPVAQSADEKIEIAKRLKDEGNDFFKKQEYKRANTRYYRALAYTRGLPGRPTAEGADPVRTS